MQEIEEQIFQIVEHVWTSFVGLQLKRRSLHEIPDAEGYFIIAAIHIEGAWEGEVALVCSEALAHRVAAHLYEIAEDKVTREEIIDTLGELSNMIGGNMKRLLPEPCHLKLPVVGYDQDVQMRITIPVHAPVPKVLADCEDRFLLVMLTDHAHAPKRIIDAL